MGGGHSSSNEGSNASVTFNPQVSDHGSVKVGNINTGDSSQSGNTSSTGAKVDAKADVSVSPTILQNLAVVVDCANLPATSMVACSRGPTSTPIVLLI